MRFKLVVLLILSTVSGFGQNLADTVTVVRPVASYFMLKLGSAHRADTYLSPLHYDGWDVGFAYERWQAPRFDPERAVMALNVDLDLDRSLNSVRNSALWGAGLRGRWGLMRRFDTAPVFSFAVGGSTTLDVGALYLARNGNNPVAARGSWTVDVTGVAVARFRLRSMPVNLVYRATLPFVGAFFAPDYGQLYYEIYLGDTSGIISPAVWGKYFRFDQRLTADFRFGGTILRLGYEFDGGSTRVHSVVTRRATHTAIIGVGGQWLTLDTNKHQLDPHARIIQALY